MAVSSSKSGPYSSCLRIQTKPRVSALLLVFSWARLVPGTEEDTPDSCQVKELTSPEYIKAKNLLEGIFNLGL